MRCVVCRQEEVRSRRARERAESEALLPGEVPPQRLLEASLTRDPECDLFSHTGTVRAHSA